MEQSADELRTVIVLRGQYQADEHGERFEGEDPSEVLRRVLEGQVDGLRFPILRILGGPITFVDADAHDWERLPSDEELAAHVAALRYQPDCWWVTHGHGLRLVYIGEHHEDRALAASLELPNAFTVELKQDSRHPCGSHPDHPGASCGPVHWGEAAPHKPVDWSLVGRLGLQERDAILRASGYEPGDRYDHDRCPIAGKEPSNENGCVVVLDQVVYCHRCAAKGVQASKHLKPGVFPIALLSKNGTALSVFARLANGFVHWAHGLLELREEYPRVAETILRDVYQKVLLAVHRPDDPRIWNVFNPSLKILKARGAWLDAETLEPYNVTNDTVDRLPACQFVEANHSGQLEIKIDTALRERAKNAFSLGGYTPIRVARGICITKPAGCLTVIRQPEGEPPVRLLPDAEMMPEAELRAILEHDFPGIDLDVLVGLVTGALCAEANGAPVIIHLTGPTGSGKNATTLLACCILGCSPLPQLRLEAGDEEWRRQIGTALLKGQKLLFIDEVARIPRLGTRIRHVLELCSSLSFRLLYASDDRIVRFEAALVLASLTMPESLAASPEVCRRIWMKRLPRTVRDWRETSGPGGIEAWRRSSPRNALAANTVVTIAYRLAHRHGFSFAHIAPELGFVRPDEQEDFVDAAALLDLYRHCRGECGKREIHVTGRFGGDGWVDGSSSCARDILERILPPGTHGEDDRSHRFFHLRQILEALDWNTVLGFDDPPVVFELRRHGSQIAIRFREHGRPKGHARLNEELPEAPGGPGQGAGETEKGDGAKGEGDLTVPTRSDSEPVISESDNKCLSDKELSGKGNSICQICQDIPLLRREEGGGNQRAEERETPKAWQDWQNASEAPAHTVANALQAPDLHHADRYASPPVTTCPDAGRTWQIGARLSLDRWPKDTLVVDFETYYDGQYSLRLLTIPEYVHDPRFHVHGLAIRWPDGKIEFRTDVEAALQEITERFGRAWECVRTVAFNAHFDGYILSQRYGIRPAFWMDPMAMARQVLPGRADYSLRAMAEALGLPPKGEELEGLEGVREPDPQQRAALEAYARRDVEIASGLLGKLLPELSRPEVELRLIDQCIRMFTEREFAVDPDGAGDLKEELQKEVDAACETAGCDRETISSDAKFTELLKAALKSTGRELPTKPDKTGKPILALAKDDPAYQQFLADPDPRVQALARARTLVQSAPAHQRRAERLEGIARATGGLLPVPLTYHAAHTGRYGGSGGINLQNLPKRTEGPAAGIAGLLRAQDGHLLVGADASQIEARILATLAGEQQLVSAFRDGRDVYCEFASGVFGEEVRKPTEEDPPELAKRLKALRFIGKQSILGLGYGMGAQKFEQKLRRGPEAAVLFQTGELNSARIERIVWEDYRRGYPAMPELWRGIEKAARDALENGVGEYGAVRFFTGPAGLLLVTLPSGRTLRYPNARINITGEISYSKDERLWGGKLVENIVQALARDFICEAMLKAEEAGYEVVLQVHDEIVVQVPESETEAAQDFLLQALRTPPQWMADLPLDAEAWIRNTYGE